MKMKSLEKSNIISLTFLCYSVFPFLYTFCFISIFLIVLLFPCFTFNIFYEEILNYRRLLIRRFCFIFFMEKINSQWERLFMVRAGKYYNPVDCINVLFLVKPERNICWTVLYCLFAKCCAYTAMEIFFCMNYSNI